MTPIKTENAENIFQHAWMSRDIVKALLNQKIYIDVWEIDDAMFTVGQVKLLDEFHYDPRDAESAPGKSEFFLFETDTPTDRMMVLLMANAFERCKTNTMEGLLV